MVIAEVACEHPLEMMAVKDDRVIEAIASDTANQPLDVGVPPR